MQRQKARVLLSGLALLRFATAPAIASAQESLKGYIGAGVTDAPYYMGSDQSRLHVVPVIDLRWKTPFFYAGNQYGGPPLQAGTTPLHTEHWVIGANVAYQTIEPRNDTASDYPTGIPTIQRTALGGVFAQFRYQGFSARIRTESDLLGNGQGSTVTLDMRQSFPLSERLSFDVGPRWVWGNREHMETFFGVNSAEAIDSHLHAYAPGSGSEEIALLFSTRYLLTQRWLLGGRVSIGRLNGTVSNSPLVLDRTQTRWTLFTAYRF